MKAPIQEYVETMPRTGSVPDERLTNQTLFLPEDVRLTVRQNGTVQTDGLGHSLDAKQKDLIELVKIREALSLDYVPLNAFGPRTFIESLRPIPAHVTVQGILFSIVDSASVDELCSLCRTEHYGVTDYDCFWVDQSLPNQAIVPGEALIILNRRVGGWDGSLERPVIELLGAGGHVPAVWNSEEKRIVSLSPKDALVKELDEEIGHSVSVDDVIVFGGFHNLVSCELVILCGVNLPPSAIPRVQEKAKGNHEENTDGLYLGTVRGVLRRYMESPSPFAGGEKAKPSNFPSQEALMKKVWERLNLYR